MKRVAIIGAGIVGSTLAYYLSKSDQVEVTVFDDGYGQATKAAAGIISPWFSKRRNKAWYRLARLGADFYQDLIANLQADDVEVDFYKQVGVYLLKKDESKLDDLYQLALSRQAESPIISDVRLLEKDQVNQVIPDLMGFEQLLYAAGGARVDGGRLVSTLLEQSQVPVIYEKVSLELTEEGYRVEGQTFDTVVLACGAWLGQILEPLGYQVDVRPQKGQLLDFQVTDSTDRYPVVMPEGELDLIPFDNGKISVGASHENDQGFDLKPNQEILKHLETEALTYLPSLKNGENISIRVGTRAYTSDFSPFYGKLQDKENLYVASGLGSSGLTTGPLIAFELANMILAKELRLNPDDYPVDRYIQKVHTI